MASVAVSKVGDIKLVLGSTVPDGYLALSEGDLLSRTKYSELWAWAQANARVISDSAWNSENSANGSCGAFSTGDGSTTFRLPKIQSILKAAGRSVASTFNKAVYNNKHYHGMGPMVNNNGSWGRLSYATSSYPSGTKGWYWNGKGGHSTYETPPNEGNIVTSLNMGDSNTSVPVPASINLLMCIRYTTEYQETAVGVSAAAAYVAVNNLTDALNDKYASYLTASVLDDIGWQLYDSGELEQWGRTQPGVGKGKIVFPVAFNTAPHNITLTVIDPKSECSSLVTRVTELTATYAMYNIDGNFSSDAYVMWWAHGKN